MKITLENMDQLAWEKGLLPAIIQNADSGVLLMQAYMNKEALKATLDTGFVTFFSRSRESLWKKGEMSGNTLSYRTILSDCDGDSLKILALPAGPVCHQGTLTCWVDDENPRLTFLAQLEDIIVERSQVSPDVSYTARLKQRGAKYIAQKVGEEAVETALAAVAGDNKELLNESADLLYHLLVLLNHAGLSLSDVAEVLHDRHKKK